MLMRLDRIQLASIISALQSGPAPYICLAYPMSTVCVGIDTGGTFTDLVAIDLDRGRYHYHKVPTITADPARGILEGIAELLDQNALARKDIGFLVLGTTLATNAVLEGKWARTGMLTTQGFRDVLELASPSRCRRRSAIAVSKSQAGSRMTAPR
jgi:N-methylhydantoinase A/oxoprolinase/acetone carboxylase beta subunit